MTLKLIQASIREIAGRELGVHANDEKKLARIALCAAVELFAACHQTRRDAHACLDHAFDHAGADSPFAALAKMEAALALVGGAEGVSLEFAAEEALRVTEREWDVWRAA